MKIGKHTKNFFTPQHFKTLNTKFTRVEYRQFIRKIHLRICEEVILSTKEGFILPNKLGDIRVSKQKKKTAVYTTHSAITKKKKEYNSHSFGCIYTIAWDKKVRGRYYQINYSHLVPSYRGKPILWFNIYKFTGTREHLKRALAKKIFNQDIVF